MMRAYEGGPGAHPSAPLRYRVLRGDRGWCVEINGCATRPLPDRRSAQALARRLQRERDRLHHADRPRGAPAPH
jgi:hypothetical protein